MLRLDKCPSPKTNTGNSQPCINCRGNADRVVAGRESRRTNKQRYRKTKIYSAINYKKGKREKESERMQDVHLT